MIGRTVTVAVDRPLGSAHPEYPDLIYPVNYGFVPSVLGGDGEEQDAYILGVDRPLERFTGQLIARIRRLDDVEDKWVVAPEGSRFTKEQIAAAVDFQERFFQSEIEL
ncbi:MAG: inorganic pyrophosphatase [Oscillospiraceae bacterium]|nr:inorganic pyrophosphatase [Oscillospiraceae bacterium]